MRVCNSKFAAAGLALCAALAGGNAEAAIQTFVGTNVTYQFDDAELGKFGPLANVSIAGNSLAFAPAGFYVTGLVDGYDFQITNVTVTAHTGYQLTAFNLNEGGSYTSNPANLAYSQGELTAIDIEGNSSDTVVGNTGPLYEAGNWSLQAGITLPGVGWGGDDGVVSQIKLTLYSQLGATGSAEIWKNAVLVEAVTTPVPEAETYAMMLAGLGLVGLMVRRRNGRAV